MPSQVLRKATLIPIPGSKRAIRKRGRDFIFELTQEVSKRSEVPMVSGISIERRLLDQSGLSAMDRKRNVYGAFAVDKSVQEISGEILLVDDLVTTGATLLEAKRALNKSGLSVNQAITACVAQTSNI